jgi:hypothetical protein
LPHVVLFGVVSVEIIFKELIPLFIKDGTEILRTTDVFLERGKNAILIDSLAIDANRKISFLAMISGREDGIVIRVYPKIEVEKTNGVKKILAELAKQITKTFPQLKITETNLNDYLK